MLIDARRGDGVGAEKGEPVGLALLVVREDLQLDGEVDLAHVDRVGHGQDGRCEVEDAADACLDQPVAHVLAAPAGSR